MDLELQKLIIVVSFNNMRDDKLQERIHTQFPLLMDMPHIDLQISHF